MPILKVRLLMMLDYNEGYFSNRVFLLMMLDYKEVCSCKAGTGPSFLSGHNPVAS
jgi:hypothetical protein